MYIVMKFKYILWELDEYFNRLYSAFGKSLCT
jgi:hypothetical protein